jgi:hypothetical protein
MTSLNFVKIYEGVNVYKNMFNNLNEMLNDLKTIEGNEIKSFGDWEGWYTFGRQRPIMGHTKHDDVLSKYVYDLEKVLKSTTDHYMDLYKMDKSETMLMDGHLCEYTPVTGGDTRTLMTMTYHVDFQQEKIGRPGLFHYITCNMYLNDDYDDGQICFSVNDDRFEYKPKAGDVVVFSSQPPYYHGVRKTLNKEKYFVRTFVMKNYSGSKEWINNQEKYGSELWEQMEKEREKQERQSYIKHQDYQEPNV